MRIEGRGGPGERGGGRGGLERERQLVYAAGDDNMAEVKRLLAEGTNINAVYAHGCTALIRA